VEEREEKVISAKLHFKYCFTAGQVVVTVNHFAVKKETIKNRAFEAGKES